MKIDYKKELKSFYNASIKAVQAVEVPEMNYIMIDGEGNPNTSEVFAASVSALFSVSYAIKFMIKKSETAIDYSVMPLEGLWWMDDMTEFTVENKHRWKWTLMIMQPELVTKEIYETALAESIKKKNLPMLSELRFEAYQEGLSAQIMHVGPYTAEEENIQRVHKYVDDNGYEKVGKHHEIYLNDMNKTVPERLKTILRQPVRVR